jgi:heme/copper-type cytochrome/quinol oxidase subunit 3
MVLITSSVTLVMAWASRLEKNLGKCRMFLGVTVLLSFVFLVIKYFEYSHKFAHNHFPSTNTFFGIYFTLTGLHGLHIVGGIVVMLWLLGPGAKLYHQSPERYTNRIEGTGLYWHFVDLVWIFLFPVLYLM